MIVCVAGGGGLVVLVGRGLVGGGWVVELILTFKGVCVILMAQEEGSQKGITILQNLLHR